MLGGEPQGAGWQQFNGHYYKVVAGSYTWDQAYAAAQAEGGYLATLTSQAELDFVQQTATPGGEFISHYAWIGASDRDPDGVEVGEWSRGRHDADLQQLGRWQPDGGIGENYAEMLFVFGGGWNDGAGDPDAQGGYVVEWGGMSGSQGVSEDSVT